MMLVVTSSGIFLKISEHCVDEISIKDYSF